MTVNLPVPSLPGLKLYEFDLTEQTAVLGCVVPGVKEILHQRLRYH